MTFSDFTTLVQDARRQHGAARLAVPVAVRRSADLLTPVAALLAFRAQGEYAFLLESVEGGEKLARYSFLGRRPYRIVEARGRRVRIHDARVDAAGDGAPPFTEHEASVFDVLGRLLAGTREVAVPGLPRLTGGAVGFMGYDCVRLLERLPDAPPDALGLPDAVWAFYSGVAAFDHVRHQLVLMATAFVEPGDDDRALQAHFADAQARLVEMEEELAHRHPEPGEPVQLGADQLASNTEEADFAEAVGRAKGHITEGDVFQLVLSQRFSMPFSGDPFNLYRALRQVNPSPYLFYLSLDGPHLGTEPFALAGSSPEVLVRIEPDPSDRAAGSRAELLPIAGTRPRGDDAQHDRHLEADLLGDPKERAEHLMLVDLGRNDLGRVCEPGSVEVEQYATVERYSHVMHIVSRVTGRLAPGANPVRALAACFPAGTVSGAPKVRAMELIDELEPEKRGPYAGAVGYATHGGALDTCIAIRTMVLKGGTAYVQAGAGIVADSDPAAEYAETHHKARALHRAMHVAAKELL
jgi:anthranilate synthase component 1